MPILDLKHEINNLSAYIVSDRWTDMAFNVSYFLYGYRLVGDDF